MVSSPPGVQWIVRYMRPPVVNIQNRSGVKNNHLIVWARKDMKLGIDLSLATALYRLGKIFVNFLLGLKYKYRIPS